MRKFTLVFILIPFLISAQNKNFKAGFDVSWDYIWFNSNHNEHSSFNGFLASIPTVYDIHFEYVYSEKFSFQTKFGYVLPLFENFGGVEYGIKAKYQFYNNLFAILGVMEHSNGPSDKRYSGGSYNINLFFTNFGFAYSVSKYFAVEINYVQPIQSKTIYYERNRSDELSLYSLKSIVRLSFVFDLIL